VNILVTGGAGFIGSNFIHFLLRSRRNVEVTNFDKLTYAGNLENLAGIADNPRCQFVRGDISDPPMVKTVFDRGFDAVVHFAAETHVDRSIEDAAPFLQTNVLGTRCLLEAARSFPRLRFIHISTDEVYGSALPNVFFDESSPLDPRSPYAASKASAEHFVTAYSNTYGISSIILRCTNNYGPFQSPEKLIPLVITNAIDNKPVPIYGDGMQERDWLFVEDYCKAISLVLEKEVSGGVYNVSSGSPQPNLEIVRAILRCLGKPESLIQFVKDRAGHDRRYALDSSKIRRDLSWSPDVSFEVGIQKTVEWYQRNPDWIKRARSGEYQTFYDRQYNRR